MSTTETTTTERRAEDGRTGRPSATRGWISLAALLGVYAAGAVSHLDPALLGGLLPGH